MQIARENIIRKKKEEENKIQSERKVISNNNPFVYEHTCMRVSRVCLGGQ